MKKKHEPAIVVNKDIREPDLPDLREGFIRTADNYDRDAVSRATALYCDDPTLTQQQFKEEVDINFIADRYGLTGELPQVLDLPRYGDFQGVFDFQTAQNAVVHAKEQFMTLPAKLRSKFDNDPQKLITFLDDPDNRDLAVAMGLVRKPEDAPQSNAGGTPPVRNGSPTPTDSKAGEQPPNPPKPAT